MSKEQTTGQKTKKKVPKVRSYVRPTRVHTPKPKKKPKYPDREVEEELGDTSFRSEGFFRFLCQTKVIAFLQHLAAFGFAP